MPTVARGLVHRGGTTVMIFIVALVAVAAAVAGPVYYTAARISILRDTLTGSEVLGHGFEANVSGSLGGTLVGLPDAMLQALDRQFGHDSAARLFGPPIESVEGTGTYQDSGFSLVWRDGFCAHLLIRGSCPHSDRQVVVSRSAAQLGGWHIGQRITGTGWAPLTITGIYDPPRLTDPYWVLHTGTYFPREAPAGNASVTSVSMDAMFTARATMVDAPVSAQGTTYLDVLLRTGRVQVADVPRLAAGMNALISNPTLEEQQITVTTAIPASFAAAQAGWRAVAVPVVVITAAILALSWLLLFLTVTEAAQARAREVALARLRGYAAVRTLIFALSEPATLLLLALPAGGAAGWAATAGLSRLLLRPGTPTGMPVLAWAAAAAATAGGLAAVGLAAQQSLRRGVAEQFRKASRSYRRGWALDAVLVTGAVAGLVELLATGAIGNASHNVLSLLVPALIGLAVAVVAARLLPLGCRALFGVSGRRGGLAWYLALRHIARRPGGVRSTMVLATAFALTAFAVVAWSVDRGNYSLVAGVDVGAPDVLTVTVPPGRDLGAIVSRADPGGHSAVAVDTYVSLTSGSGGDVTLAVDPQRFARVAFWQPGFAVQPLSRLTRELAPAAPPPVILTGDAMRLRVRVTRLSVPGELVSANVTTGSSPVALGALPAHGSAVLTGSLVGCPCVLRSIELSVPGTVIHQAGLQGTTVSGDLTITGMQVHQGGHWRPARRAALAAAGDWRAGDTRGTLGQPAATGLVTNPPDQITAVPGGLHWSFTQVPSVVDPTLVSVNQPAALPALIPAVLAGHRGGLFSGVGLDGSTLPLRLAAAVAAVPGAPANGVIVDRHYAELAAGYDLSQAGQEVWVAGGAVPRVERGLRAQGVRIDSERSISAAAATLRRQGPALASVLFLAEATAAALLAAGATVLGIFLSARRRRYEYAALAATRLSRRTLARALLIELAVVLSFGTVTGLVTGVMAALLVLPDVPEFVTQPIAPPLSYALPGLPLAALAAAAVALLAVTSVAISVVLLRGVRSDLLRETPP